MAKNANPPKSSKRLKQKNTTIRRRKVTKIITLEDRKKAVLHTERGTALLTADDVPGALREFNRALNLDPRQAAAWTKRGSLRLTNGELEGAIRDLSNAIILDSSCVEAYEKRGVARERSGDRETAKQDYKKSIEIQVRKEIMRQISGD